MPCPYFTPQIIEVNNKTVIHLDIPCGQYVYRYNDRFWDRNGDADIDVTDHPELLLSLFERTTTDNRKSPTQKVCWNTFLTEKHWLS